MDAIQKNLLEQVADLHEIPTGAYNIRTNGGLAGRNTTANIDLLSFITMAFTRAATRLQLLSISAKAGLILMRKKTL